MVTSHVIVNYTRLKTVTAMASKCVDHHRRFVYRDGLWMFDTHLIKSHDLNPIECQQYDINMSFVYDCTLTSLCIVYASVISMTPES